METLIDQLENLKSKINKIEWPQEWEVSEDWEKEVAKPVILYPLAPREARLILNIYGLALSYGMNPKELMYNILNTIENKLKCYIKLEKDN